MSITVTEKEHWKTRIARKIERAIQALVAQHDPEFLNRIKSEAESLAIDALGGRELIQRRAALNASRDTLKTELEDVERQMFAIAQGKSSDSNAYYYNVDSEWNKAVANRREVIEVELLSKQPLGQRILKLRCEEEELLDTVWLATSPSQIRALWQNVTELLADELTDLQKKALASEQDAK